MIDLQHFPAMFADWLARVRIPMYRGQAIRSAVLALVVVVLSISSTIIGTQSAMGLWGVLMERLQFPMIHAEIESLRQDAATTACDQSAMLRATVAAVNQRIEHEHESNSHLWSDWASTDKWQAVERIRFQCELVPKEPPAANNQAPHK